MHVGLFSPVWPPGKTANGIVTYVQVVRDGLRRKGHRVTVFSGVCESSDADGIVQVKSSRHSDAWQAVRRRFGRTLEAPYDFGPLLASAVLARHRRDPLDVFEMEESFGWCGELARRVPVPTVVKLHGPAFLSLIDGDEETPARQQRISSEGEALHDAHCVVSPSASTLSLAAARYGLSPAKLSSIPNPVAEVADSLVWSADAIRSEEILYVGRFDYRKGGGAILQVFARVAALRPKARLTFVGPDSGLRLPNGHTQHFADHVRENFAPDVAARIQYLGSRPPSEIAALRRGAAVTVTATRWESFGYVVAEAMSQGCPVVGFDVDGVNELIENERSGLLAPLDDLDALAHLVCRVLDDRALAVALGSGARRAIASSCAATVVIEHMVALYEGLVRAKTAGLTT